MQLFYKEKIMFLVKQLVDRAWQSTTADRSAK